MVDGSMDIRRSLGPAVTQHRVLRTVWIESRRQQLGHCGDFKLLASTLRLSTFEHVQYYLPIVCIRYNRHC